MAKRADESTAAPEMVTGTPDVEKITRLLALLVVKGEAQPDKIRLLSGAGFANTEIARLLGMKANAVNQAVHRIRAKR